MLFRLVLLAHIYNYFFRVCSQGVRLSHVMIPGKWQWINEKYKRKILSSIGWRDEDKREEWGQRQTEEEEEEKEEIIITISLSI